MDQRPGGARARIVDDVQQILYSKLANSFEEENVIPHIATHFTDEELELFHQIELLVQEVELPDLGLEGDARALGAPPDSRFVVSCHMITRAIATLYPQLTVEDGDFLRGYSHSWLITGKGNIIDPYPWAMVGGPVMLTTDGLSPWGSSRIGGHESVYQKDAKVDEWFGGEPFLTHVDLVTDAFRATAERLDFV